MLLSTLPAPGWFHLTVFVVLLWFVWWLEYDSKSLVIGGWQQKVGYWSMAAKSSGRAVGKCVVPRVRKLTSSRAVLGRSTPPPPPLSNFLASISSLCWSRYALCTRYHGYLRFSVHSNVNFSVHLLLQWCSRKGVKEWCPRLYALGRSRIRWPVVQSAYPPQVEGQDGWRWMEAILTGLKGPRCGGRAVPLFSQGDTLRLSI